MKGDIMNTTEHTCCICGKKFKEYGNNPAPVKDDGLCCNECNYSVVIPARMDMMFPARKMHAK